MENQSHAALTEYLEDFSVTQVGVVDKETFIIVGDWDPDDPEKPYPQGTLAPTRVITANFNKMTALYTQYKTALGRCRVAGGYIDGNKQALIVDMNGNVTFYGYQSGVNGNEGYIPKNTIRCVRLIGKHFYASSALRKVFRRNSPDDWELISQYPYDQARATKTKVDPLSFDGFDEEDIYMCGQKGDLWHFNGRDWRPQNPPCNWNMEHLICGTGGKVYVASSQGELLVGRSGRWDEVITLEDTEKQHIPHIYSMTWFKDTLYMADGSRVRRLVGDRWEPVSEIFGGYGCERIDANDEVMIVGCSYRVTLFDGEKEMTLYEKGNYHESATIAAAVANLGTEVAESLGELTKAIEESGNTKP
jgi:hypothetical protein